MSQMLTLYTTPVIYLAFLIAAVSGVGSNGHAWSPSGVWQSREGNKKYMQAYRKFSIMMIGMSIVISAYAVGPNYVSPSVPVPEKYKEVAKNWQLAAQPQDRQNRGQWWRIYPEPQLDALEEQLLLANPSILNTWSTT